MSKELNWASDKPQINSTLEGDLIVGKFGPKEIPSYIEVSKLRGYKVYTCGLTQTSTNAPVETTLVDELGLGSISWARTSAGLYVGTLTGLYTKYSKVTAILAPTITTQTLGVDCTNGLFTKVDDNSFQLLSYEVVLGSAADGILNNTLFEIRAYY